MDDLETTVRDLAPAVLRYSLGATGDRSLAEEVAQDALAALVGRWRRSGPPREPEAFVIAVARRRAARRLVRKRMIELATPLDAASGLVAAPRQPIFERLELAETVAALRRLDRRDREAILLVAAAGLTPARAAAILGIRAGTLRMRLARARVRLREILESKP
jgi:RNA polymerase sigma-70 factor (ECF subfamily)